MERRTFVRLLSGIPALGGIPFSLAAEERGHNFSLMTAPYLQHLTADGVTICWIVNSPSSSWVTYWEKGNEENELTARTTMNGLFLANNTVNAIRLDDLHPATTYCYQVHSTKIKDFQPYSKEFGTTLSSAIHEFTTVDPSSETLEVLVLNDIHDRPRSFAALESLYGGKTYDMVVLNGDMFDHQDSEQQLIDHLIRPCTDIFASGKPFYLLRGNHETRGVFAYELPKYFDNGCNRPYFSIIRAGVFFVALDTGEDKEDSHKEYDGLADFDRFRIEQAAWLQKQLASEAAKQAKYRVIFMHIPPFHSGVGHGAAHCRRLFAPILEKGKVDLVLSGHTHRYGIHEPNDNHPYPIVIGGGPREGTRTLVKLQVSQAELNVTLITDSGTVADRLVLK